MLNLKVIVQHIDFPTHIAGHTLDLLITRKADPIQLSNIQSDYLISDHLTVLFNFGVSKPKLEKKTIEFRPLRDIDISHLKNELSVAFEDVQFCSINLTFFDHHYQTNC